MKSLHKYRCVFFAANCYCVKTILLMICLKHNGHGIDTNECIEEWMLLALMSADQGNFLALFKPEISARIWIHFNFRFQLS